MLNLLYTSRIVCFDDYPDAYIPELWANESLAILEENMVMAELVYRDFSSEVASFGDVVNTRKPGEFHTTRKSADDDVVSQTPTADNVPVKLDQHFYQTFTIKDEDGSKAFLDLVDIYLQPAALQLVRGIDRGLLARTPDFISNTAGRLNEMSKTNAKDFMLDARKIMNVNRADVAPRHLVLSPDAETTMLETELFIAANQRGDGGTALENARLGRLLGFDTYMDQNVPSWGVTATDVVAGAVTGATAAGATGDIAIPISSYIPVVGQYAYIVGEGQVQRITDVTDDSTNTTHLEFADAFVNGCEAGAVCHVVKTYDVDGTYAAGYQKYLVVDGYTTAPAVGQLITIGTGSSSNTYMIIDAYVDPTSGSKTRIWLDRPLEALVSDGALVYPLPYGGYNLAFNKNAIALVNRPLALPRPGLGASAAIASANNLSVRAVMQYVAASQGTIVTLDMLAGFKTLDANRGCIMLS